MCMYFKPRKLTCWELICAVRQFHGVIYSQSTGTSLSRLSLSGNGCVESWVFISSGFGYLSLRVAKIIFKPNSLGQIEC